MLKLKGEIGSTRSALLKDGRPVSGMASTSAHLNFVDFDGIIRERLHDIVGKYGIPHILIRTFKALYHQSSSSFTDGETYPSWFEEKSSVRYGCVMSGFISVFIMDWHGHAK